jgi:arylsulfatase A-like enzyme
VQFNNQFCQWPLCGPSRANIFTGCRPLTTERYNNQPFFPNFRKKRGTEFRSLPEHFRLNGYQSLGAGLVYHDVEDPPSWSQPKWEPSIPQTVPKWAEGWLPPENVQRWQNPHSLELMRQRLERLQAEGYTPEQCKDPSVWRKAQGPAVEAIDADDEIYHDGKVTRKALEYLEQMDSEQPFFLATGFIAGHTPYMAPQKYWDLYDRQQLRLPENLEVPEGSPEWASGDSEPSQFYTQDGYEKPWRADREQSLELLHGHYATISYIDAQVGALLDALKRLEMHDNTVIVLVSDHGFHDGEHGYWGKHNLWDASLQVPLLLRIPGMSDQGIQINALTEHVDIYPTLCDLCDLPKPDFLEGTSTMPLIENPARPWKQAVFAHRKHMWHDRIQAYAIANTVRTQTRRLTVYLDERGSELYVELFNYAHDPCGQDPLETTNVANDQKYNAAMREMRSLLHAGWRACIPGT